MSFRSVLVVFLLFSAVLLCLTFAELTNDVPAKAAEAKHSDKESDSSEKRQVDSGKNVVMNAAAPPSSNEKAPFVPQGKMPMDPDDVVKKEITDRFKKAPANALTNLRGALKEFTSDSKKKLLDTAGSYVSIDFWHGFVASLSVIIVSELGDKTWFIAAIMAMRHSRLTVFFGAMAALGLMTALSASLGWATQIIPRKVTYYVSTALFALFGLKMLKEGWDMSPNEGQEEYEDAQAEVMKKESEMAKADLEASSASDAEAGLLGGGAGAAVRSGGRTTLSMILRFVSRIFLEAFTLTFIAEWGDRSQIATIILAAREDVVGVTIGGILGHAICTGIAVLGGRLVAQKISVRTVTLIGGVVFIMFALSAFVMDPLDSTTEATKSLV